MKFRVVFLGKQPDCINHTVGVSHRPCWVAALFLDGIDVVPPHADDTSSDETAYSTGFIKVKV